MSRKRIKCGARGNFPGILQFNIPAPRGVDTRE